jgi:hypothetical protein
VAVTTPTVTDDKGNTWTQVGLILTTGNVRTAQFIALNIAAGTVKVTVAFNVYVYTFQACLTEFQNVGSLDVSNRRSSSGTVDPGPLTTTAPGDLIYHYGFAQSTTGAISNIAAGSGFSLLSADVFLGTFAQFQVQSAAGSITPSVVVTGGTDTFNSIAVALKPANQGSPGAAGIRIVRVIHQLWNRGTTNTPISSTGQVPTQGNLLIMATSFPAAILNVTVINDTNGSTWTKQTVTTPTPGFAQVWYTSNSSPSLATKITATLASGGAPNTLGTQTSFVFYDVVNAATAPFDTVAGVVTQSVSNQNNTPITLPTISPSTANGLVLAVMGNTFGPTTGLTNASQRFDTVTYTGQKDNDNMDNADGYGHFYNTAAGAVSFTWAMASVITAETSFALALAFKSSSGGTGPVPVNATVHIK